MSAASLLLSSRDGCRTRRLRIGGISKEELLSTLHANHVGLNEAALALFADPRFTTSSASATVEIVELPVAALGFPEGATFAELAERAKGNGLELCPLEAGAHLRLQFTDQPEGALGQPHTRRCAPPGSLTVASEPLAQDDETPKGFYLRRIEGALWLRGYRSWPGHRWSPHDVIAFLRPRKGA